LRSVAEQFIDVVSHAMPGAVVKLGASLELENTLEIPTGVTIRGDRTGTNVGPTILHSGTQAPIDPMLTVQIYADIANQEPSSDVRITGVKLAAPSRSTADPQTDAFGVIARDVSQRVLIDHNDVHDWPKVAIQIKANDSYAPTQPCDPAARSDPTRRQ